MRLRCQVCGAIGSSKHPCKKCGSKHTMTHCHDRAHRSHILNPFRRRDDSQPLFKIALGYKGEDLPLTTCEHNHPYDEHVHLDEPHHEEP